MQGLNIHLNISKPKMGDQVSGGVKNNSTFQHTTTVANVPWKPL